MLVQQHQRAAEFIQPFHLVTAASGFQGALLSPCGKLARNNGGNEERKQSDPILRICNSEGKKGWKEKEVEAENTGDRSDNPFEQAPRGSDAQSRQKECHRDCRVVRFLEDKEVKRSDSDDN